ncbi:MAG: outer membrane lipid asymmetry maintenance protein MlaD [Acidithiobacillales bacterium SM23_46]|jgi:phospholipid/cholesterol/gamma-HCH transport system substrate-binding protein|nr:MAG: outer membrane lipid asymmetry maintenance protein MlaD [Acidithiobacillales bacterium SM23_46]KPL28877.1 MAG: outer membrane lipid asymmetry maintenance protein MlaD [Acidithiobacillales bacterium SM1_46]
MLNNRLIEFWVGVFVIAGLVALTMLAFRVSNLTAMETVDGYKVTARFNNVGQLKVKAPITLAGVRIGRVSEIVFDSDKYQAVVTLEIDGRFRKIPRDSSASILTAGLLGEQYVGLEAGADEEFLRQGDSLMLTQSALVLEKLIGQLVANLASSSGKK